MKVGDLVRMLSKNYSSPGIHVPDQWEGLTGIVVGQIDDWAHWPAFSVLIKHPDDSAPYEILICSKDAEVINEA